MSSHKNVIELNGKLFDAVTGKPVHQNPVSVPHKTAPVAAPAVKPKRPVQSGVALDGFVGKPRPLIPKPVAPAAPAKTIQRAAASHAKRHAPQRTKTLIRRGLHKPTPQPQPDTAAAQPTTPDPQPAAQNNRHERARHIAQSHKITKFGPAAHTVHWFDKKQQTVPVKAAPQPQLTAPAAQHYIARKAQSVAHKSTSSKALIERALEQAPTEHHPPHKRHKNRVAHRLGMKRKTLNLGAGLAALLLLGGFILFQNSPNLSMRLAATRAGFNAQLPNYQPAGFGMSGPIQYGPGQVTVNFRSNSDDRNFNLTQRVSQWNSESLLDNFVLANNKTYQTYQDRGRTIYIYDGNNATWVSGGVWYQIEGNSRLSSDQLLRVANSI